MPDLLIRDLNPATHEALRRRARGLPGVPLQAEVHRILDSASRAADPSAAPRACRPDRRRSPTAATLTPPRPSATSATDD